MPGRSGGRTAGTEIAGIAVGRLRAVSECVEFICERHHEIATERVGADVFDIVCRYCAADVRVLAEQVVGLERYGGLAVAQELIGNRRVPHPLIFIITGRVASGRREIQVSVQHNADRSYICCVEHAAVGVDGVVAYVGK